MGARAPSPLPAGYFGKVPTQGDFVFRGLPLSLNDRLDAWLRQSVQSSQRQMGREWLPAFLVAPVWRMAITPGLFGPDALVGVMMPSVDRAGRYFPLVIAAPIPGLRASAADLARMTTWFDAAEETALSTLDPHFSLGWFDEQIAGLSLPASLLPRHDPQAAPGSIWWTAEGGGQVTLDQMPQPDAFGALFLPRRDPVSDQPPAQPVRKPLRLSIGRAIHKTARQLIPPDQIIVSPDCQAITLLNGIGQSHNLLSSVQIAADTLARIDEPMSMSDLVQGAKGRIGTANSLLLARAVPDRGCAVSFATLLLQGHLFALLWAGNTRAYLLREGTLTQLTREHTERRMPSLLTRALGISKQFAPDQAGGDLLPGDRFLLCSATMSAALQDSEIAQALAEAPTAEQAATILAQDALIAGVAGSVSVVAVFAEDAV
ncbi:MAG: type VI secretion system-associated protein TagF [Paracoccus sp. (in: a-proteobacteria)]|nr:type VI secretion system-associated protein TagF [Paracoccus sp. (in: a-proteobacteria)]